MHRGSTRAGHTPAQRPGCPAPDAGHQNGQRAQGHRRTPGRTQGRRLLARHNIVPAQAGGWVHADHTSAKSVRDAAGVETGGKGNGAITGDRQAHHVFATSVPAPSSRGIRTGPSRRTGSAGSSKPGVPVLPGDAARDDRPPRVGPDTVDGGLAGDSPGGAACRNGRELRTRPVP